MFAANGFMALSHNYTRDLRWPAQPDIDGSPLESTVEALASLRAEAAAWGRGVGLYGASRGAERALLVAQLMAEDGCPGAPDAVALHSPPDAAWPAFIAADFMTGAPWAGDPHRPAWSWRGGHERTRPGAKLGAEALECPVFIAKGSADAVWDPAMARRLAERMTRAGRALEAYFFEGEGHVFRAEARNREWALLLDFFGRHLARPR